MWVAYDPGTTGDVHVTLKLYRTSQGTDLIGSSDDDPDHGELEIPRDPSVRVGQRLRIALPQVRLKTGNHLEPGTTYAYDIEFDGVGLKDLGLLDDAPIGDHKHRHLALGYTRNHLPTFRTLPRTAEELVIAHGSCRKTGGGGPDAMVALDQIIKDRQVDDTRPHILFFTGDQIYADDPTPELLEWMADLGNDLIGRDGSLCIERMRVEIAADKVVEFPADKFHFPVARRQRLMARAAEFSSEDNWQHAVSLGEIAAEYLMSWSNVPWQHNLDDPTTWKALHTARKDLVSEYLTAWRQTVAAMRNQHGARIAKDAFASVDDEVEERVRYIDAWRLLPLSARALEWARANDPDATAAAAHDAKDWHAEEEHWKKFWASPAATAPTPAPASVIAPTSNVTDNILVGDKKDLAALAKLFTPAWFAGGRHYYVTLDSAYATNTSSPNAPPADITKLVIKADHHINNLRRLRSFYQALPFARRAMANISTLMIFDDHEVTDDWAADRDWVTGVQGTALGRDIITNALVAYALFQDWGNDPKRYVLNRKVDSSFEQPVKDPEHSTPNHRLLDLIPKMFFDETTLRREGPLEAVRNEIEVLFNPATANKDRATWRFGLTDAVDPPYEILLLDSRTRRGYDVGDSPPAPISLEQIDTQIPDQGPATSKVTIVISPLPILGFPPVEQLKPLGVMKAEFTSNPDKLGTDQLYRLGVFPEILKDYSFGKMEFDPDPWAFHPEALDKVLARLSTRKSVVLLSGDIHFAMTAKLTYWKHERLGLDPKMRVAQLVSSALRNEPGLDRRKYVQLAVAEQIGAILSGPYDRLGWASAGNDGPTFETGSFYLRRLMQISPVLIPVRILPEEIITAIRARTFHPAPEWAWRADLVKDDRPDDIRYARLTSAGEQPKWRLVEEAELTADPVGALRRIAAHHEWHSRHGMPRRQFMYTNLGIVRFEPAIDDKPFSVVHSLYSWDLLELGPAGGAMTPNTPWPDARLAPDVYTEYRVSLDPADGEVPPDQTP